MAQFFLAHCVYVVDGLIRTGWVHHTRKGQHAAGSWRRTVYSKHTWHCPRDKHGSRTTRLLYHVLFPASSVDWRLPARSELRLLTPPPSETPCRLFQHLTRSPSQLFPSRLYLSVLDRWMDDRDHGELTSGCLRHQKHRVIYSITLSDVDLFPRRLCLRSAVDGWWRDRWHHGGLTSGCLQHQKHRVADSNAIPVDLHVILSHITLRRWQRRSSWRAVRRRIVTWRRWHCTNVDIRRTEK